MEVKDYINLVAILISLIAIVININNKNVINKIKKKIKK